MNIENDFKKIEEWITKKNILLVGADFQENKSPLIIISSSSEKSHETLFSIIEKLDIKIIIYNFFEFDNETYDIFISKIGQIEDEEILEQFDAIKPFKGKWLGYSLHFYDNGITYRYQNYLDVVNDFVDVRDAVTVIQFPSLSGKRKYKALTQKQINDFAIKLVNHENYSKLKNRKQREVLAKEVFEADFQDYNISYEASEVVAAAESYFETKIKPKIEMELKEKVKKLKNQGWTKVNISAELGISKDAVSKYY